MDNGRDQSFSFASSYYHIGRKLFGSYKGIMFYSGSNNVEVYLEVVKKVRVEAKTLCLYVWPILLAIVKCP